MILGSKPTDAREKNGLRIMVDVVIKLIKIYKKPVNVKVIQLNRKSRSSSSLEK